MSKVFAVGDWVRLVRLEGAITPPLKIDDFDGIDYIVNTMKCATSDLVHWKPKSGEYCWFCSVSGCSELGQFVEEYVQGRYRYRANGTNSLFNCDKERCEPFIGELPSFLKDKQ